MRIATQLGVLAVVGALGAGWHFLGPQFGLPSPVALLGLGKAPPAVAAGGGGAGGPRGGLPVVVAPVRVGEVIERVEAVGTARARDAVTITSRVSGIVTVLRFNEGQKVAAGDVLVELDRSQQAAEYDRSRAAADDARTRLNRARQLRQTQAVAEAQIDQLEAQLRQAEAQVRQASAKIEEMKIVAPFGGRVGIRQVSLGALIPPGTVVTTLDDLSRMRLEFSVPEIFVSGLKPGMTVGATSPAFDKRRFEGKVTVVDTRIDPATRAVRLIAEFDNGDEALKPGMFVTIDLTLASRTAALLVPEDAVDPIGGQAFVYVIRGGRAARQEVRLGMRLPGEVEITTGLKPDDQVVVRGLQRLRDGMPVNVTEVMRRPVS